MEMSTAFFFHDEFLQHDTGQFHPENPKRLTSIVSGLRQSGLLNELIQISPSSVTDEQILLCHTQEHYDTMRKYALLAPVQIDSDTRVSEHSLNAALLAAGAAVQAVDDILDEKYTNAFAASRPPGHHATSNRAMGFCLFNNIAIAARHAVQNRGLKRVLIMDWDVHHGNGTQDIFYADPSVFYISLHKKYHYPGTGWEEERGSGAAEGTNLNIPLPGIPGPERYEEKFREALVKAQSFEPEFIFISCGFDAHQNDPLGNLGLTDQTYGRLTAILQEFASQFGHQRIFSILEGGYDYSALAGSTVAHLSQLAGIRTSANAS